MKDREDIDRISRNMEEAGITRSQLAQALAVFSVVEMPFGLTTLRKAIAVVKAWGMPHIDMPESEYLRIWVLAEILRTTESGWETTGWETT